MTTAQNIFFFSTAKQKRIAYYIEQLYNEESKVMEDNNHIAMIMQKYLLGVQRTRKMQWIYFIWKSSILVQQQLKFCRPFTNEDVKKVVLYTK